MDPILLTVCTVPYNMMFDQHALEMNEKVRNLNKVIRDIHRKSVLPVRLLDVAERMEKKGFLETPPMMESISIGQGERSG